ncbi:MAG: sugar phosphate isomerase/epimerase family protein [Rubrobacteraceae bacterium]|jgi:sugar phosphate isomerase/epimerase
MSIPVIFSTGSLYTFGIERVFSWISESGYDGAEVMMDDRWDTHQKDYLRDLSDRHGVRILALHPPIYEGAWRLPPGETLARSARMAKSLDIPTVVAHPPRPAEIREWHDGPLRKAREEGVVVAVENMPKSLKPRGFLGFGGSGSSYLPEHLDGLGELTLDTSHVAASRLDLMGVYAALAGRLRHVHLSDSDLSGGDQHRLPGKGRLPLRPFLAALARDGYPGAVSLELKPFQSGAPHPEKILERMGEALRFVREGLVLPA